MVRDEDVNAVAVMDEVSGRIELETLGDLLQNKRY